MKHRNNVSCTTPRRSFNTSFFRFFFYILLLCCACFTVHAQDTLRIRYGLFGGYSVNIHSADFRALPGVPNCCPRFESGSGGGLLFGGLIEFPFTPSIFLSLRGSYVMHDALLSAIEPVTVIVNGVGIDGAFEHTVDAGIASIGLEPGLGIRLFGDAYATLGIRGGAFIGSAYTQEERIVNPADRGTFLDGNGQDTRSRVRNANAGDIPDAATLLLQGVGGLAYELPVNDSRTMFLVPELSYALAFTDVVIDVDWKANGLRAGLAFKYSPKPTPPKPLRYDTLIARDTTTQQAAVTAPRVTLLDRKLNTTELEGPDTIVLQTAINERYLLEVPLPPPMTCALTATGVDDNGKEEPIATLRIEEFLSMVAHPLLHFIFFDTNTAQLSARYTVFDSLQAAKFRVEDLYSAGTLEVYYSVLNIIGQRLQKYRNATLTLTGCNMDTDAEKGNVGLSRERAETVRAYLMNVWGIDGARLKVEAVNLPVKKSNPTTVDGQTENRRVEITASMPDVMDVFIAQDTLRTSSSPIIRMRPVITSPQGIATWELTAMQRGKVLQRFAGTGPLPADIDWDLANHPASVPRYNDPVTITLKASSPAGETVSCAVALPTQVLTIQQKRENRVGDYTIDRYNLILFSVGESYITPTNQRVIDLVKSRLNSKSELTIEGFADRTGNAASNKRLSASRAKATADALGQLKATTRGIGEDRLLYDNDLPEGRYYCRTVQILGKTPVNQ